jgi:oligoendopeptidase F
MHKGEIMSKEILNRTQVQESDTWDLSGMFASPEDWENGFSQYKDYLEKIPPYSKTLFEGSDGLFKTLNFFNELRLLEETVGHYAQIRTTEDIGNSEHQERLGKFMSVAGKIEAASSFLTPGIQSLDEKLVGSCLEEDRFAPYRVYLRKLLRFKPHILSEQEEKILALQLEASETAQNSFQALTDADMNFGTISTPEGERPLSNSSYNALIRHKNREVREKSYMQFYSHFQDHENTLASLYAGSVHQDIFTARARNYPSAREAALFRDKVPTTVYDNLIATVHKNLPTLHRYYKLRKRALGLDTLKHYDVYVPFIGNVDLKTSYEEAVDMIIPALAPLGEEYTSKLRAGLTEERWVDRYENKGKRSGAFSSGAFVGNPYILMNFKEDVFRDVFTLAHEGGHSMHSWYSSKSNPFPHYHYTIFEAEVASTFNEQLLGKYLMDRSESDEMRAYLISKQIDDIVGTIYRQTMFAEFEHLSHKIVEEGGVLTIKKIRETYRSLLEKYFGPDVELPEYADLEALRIPHFYFSFYVYKYATGLSASISLAQKVLNGTEKDRDEYLNFLKSGGSKYPLESLALAGVDMSQPQPVQSALDYFNNLVETLDSMI